MVKLAEMMAKAGIDAMRDPKRAIAELLTSEDGTPSTCGSAEMHERTRGANVTNNPIERIFGVVADVARYDEFLPFCTGSRVLTRDEAKLNTEISVGYGPLVSNFRSLVSLEPQRRIHAISDPSELLESLEFTWTFKALSERATRLDLALDFEMRSLEHDSSRAWQLGSSNVMPVLSAPLDNTTPTAKHSASAPAPLLLSGIASRRGE